MPKSNTDSSAPWSGIKHVPARFVSHYALYILNYGVQAIAGILIANIYLAEAFGQFSYYSMLMIFLTAFSQLGTTQSFIVLAGRKLSSRKLIPPFFVLRLAGYGVTTILLLLCLRLTGAPPLAFVFLLWLLPITIDSYPILDYFGHALTDVKIKLFDTLPFVLIFAGLLWWKAPIELIVLLRASTRSCAEIAKYQFLAREVGIPSLSRRYLSWYFRNSWIFLANRLVVEGYARSEIILLGLLASDQDVGVYSVAYTFMAMALVAEGLPGRILFANLARAAMGYRSCRDLLVRSAFYKSLIFIPVVAITWLGGSALIFEYVITADVYQRSELLLNICMLGVLPSIFANNTNFLLFADNKSLYIGRFALGLALNLILGSMAFWAYSLEGYVLAIQVVRILGVAYSVTVSIALLHKLKDQEMVCADTPGPA